MTNKKNTHVFFDLDHTLWDFDANNRLTFRDILDKHHLNGKIIPGLDAFMQVYMVHNRELWDQYKKGEIVKEYLSYRRFELSLMHFGVHNTDLAKKIAEDYINISPTKTLLVPGVFEALDYLRNKYKLAMITNGFNEIQFVKIRLSGLEPYFPLVVTSEEAGYKKPDPRIFGYALEKAGAKAADCIYVGDEPETDIVGAQAAGLGQVLVTFGKTMDHANATYVVQNVTDLIDIL
jgi:putative hydrolase of the HAD superfamily